MNLFLLLFAGSSFSSGFSEELDKSASFYRNNKMMSSINTGMKALNLALQRFSSNMVEIIPEFSNFVIVETNSSYSLTIESGVFDFYLSGEKVFSNESEMIHLLFDTSLNNIERFYNLFRSYDYLEDKGNYKRFSVPFGKTNQNYFLENENAYLLFSFKEQGDQISSGLLVKASFDFIKNVKNTEKEKKIETRIKEFVDKFKVKKAALLLQ